MLVSSRKAEKEARCTQHASPATNLTLRYVYGERLQDATDNPAAHTLPNDDAGNVHGVELTRDAWSATAENWLWGGSALMPFPEGPDFEKRHGFPKRTSHREIRYPRARPDRFAEVWTSRYGH